jgi:transposase
MAPGSENRARLVTRALVVLAAAEGKENQDIAAELNISRGAVARWRDRFATSGIAGTRKDAPRGGRPPKQRSDLVRRIIEMTTQEKPANATRWSTRTLAEALGTDRSLVHRVWRAHGLKPHLCQTFKVSNDPHFAEKLLDVVGLYLDPPEHALVPCVDEKSQIQAPDRTQKGLPIYPGRCATMTHGYKRNGTTTLLAALEVLEGGLIGQCMPRHRHQEFIKFLKKIGAETPPGLDLHLIVDNCATHKHPKVKAWLGRRKRFRLHFIPTSSSWLNLVERWFREITDERIRRGVFTSAAQPIEAIRASIDDHNDHPGPFVWTAKAEDILAKVRRAKAVLDKIASE